MKRFVLFLFIFSNTFGQKWISYRSMEYYFGTKEIQFEKASSTCESAGGHLVVVNNKDLQHNLSVELRFRNARLQGTQRIKYWIGLRRNSSQLQFRWVNGSTVSYTNWAVNEPSMHNCVAMDSYFFWYRSNKWRTYSCQNKLAYYICQRIKGATTTTSISTNTTITTSNAMATNISRTISSDATNNETSNEAISSYNVSVIHLVISLGVLNLVWIFIIIALLIYVCKLRSRTKENNQFQAMSGTIQNNCSFVSSTKENLTTKKTDIPLDVGYIVPETTFVRGNEYLTPMSSDYVRPTSTAYLQPDPIEINYEQNYENPEIMQTFSSSVSASNQFSGKGDGNLYE